MDIIPRQCWVRQQNVQPFWRLSQQDMMEVVPAGTPQDHCQHTNTQVITFCQITVKFS